MVLDGDQPEPEPITQQTTPDDRSPTVPQKKARVGASPAMPQSITAAGAQIGLDAIKDAQAEAVRRAQVKDTL